MSKKEIDLNQYDVTVAGSIWLGGRIIGVGTYKPPVLSDLVEFAKTQVEEQKPLAYFSINGDKVNPFVVLDDLDIPGGNGNGNNGEGNGGGSGKNELDIESMFKSADEFGEMSDKNQVGYISSVKDAPDELSEADAEEYDKVLFNVLNAYKAKAKTKALVEIESVLALYED